MPGYSVEVPLLFLAGLASVVDSNYHEGEEVMLGCEEREDRSCGVQANLGLRRLVRATVSYAMRYRIPHHLLLLRLYSPFAVSSINAPNLQITFRDSTPVMC